MRLDVQGSAKRLKPGLVNFVSALTYHFFLALPAAFTKPGRSFLAEHCNAARRPESSNRSKMQRQDPSQVILPLGRSHSIGAAAVGRVLATRASLQAGSTGDSLSVRATAVLVRVARTLAALPSRCVVVGAASFRCESASTPFILRSPSCGLGKRDVLEPPSDYRGFESFEDNAARE